MFSKKFWKKWGLYIVSVIVAVVLVVIAAYMSIPAELQESLWNYFTENKDGKKLTIGFLISIAQLIFLAVFVKVLLAQRAFLDAIYEHFRTIFVEKDIIKLYSQDDLKEIAKQVDKVHDGINISFDELKSKSIKLLEEEWKAGSKSKNYIVTESEYIDTIYSDDDDYEIKHKKTLYKMMQDGDFEHKYYIIPFDKKIIPDDFDNTIFNRWNNKNFKFLAKRIKTSNQTVDITTEFSVENENGKDWIVIKMKHEATANAKLKKGDEFMIELSLSQPIDLENKDRCEEYYSSVYDTIHAVRSVKFQIETYNGKDRGFTPIIKVNGNPESGNPIDSIYYKTWQWNFYHCDYKEKEIKISLIP